MVTPCEVCQDLPRARCIRCEGPACLECDRCHGCGQIFCGTCNADPSMEPQLFPGDSWPHPQSTPA